MNTTQAIKQESATEKRQHGSQTPTPHNIIDQTTQRKRRIMSNSQQRQFTQPPVKRETTAPKTAAQPDANADPDAKSTFGSCDLHLLKTGAHADTRIRVGEKEFFVHRAIIGGRSGYFHKRLQALDKDLAKVKIQERAANPYLPTIFINHHSAFDVEMVLVFIYAHEIDPKCDIDPSFAVSCIRLFNLGHDFEVTNLPDFATAELGAYLSNALRLLCDQRLHDASDRHPDRSIIQDRLRENNFLPHYIAAVELADKTVRRRPELLRPFQMLIDFFVAGKETLLAEPDMELFLDADVVPSFARNVLLTERRGHWGRSCWMRGLVERPPKMHVGKKGLCWECNLGLRNMKETRGVGMVNPKSFEVNYTQALCVNCCERKANQDQDGLVRWEVFDAPIKD